MKAENSYYERLGRIRDQAMMLRGLNIPETDHECQALQERLADAEFAMTRMLQIIQPYVQT